MINKINSTLVVFNFVLGIIFSNHSVAQAVADPHSYRIYLDADLSNNENSGNSIALGIKTALSEVNFQIGNYKLELILKDHHGSSSRSRYNLEQISKDERTLAVFGGMHSPPLIKSQDFINQRELLTFVPWAAATPITRPNGGENWIFRLSVDDSKAGEFLISHAIETSKFKRPYLMLENTGWGKANEKTMTAALAKRGMSPSGMSYFKWGIGLNQARSLLETALSSGADVIVLVANAPEGITFANAILSVPEERQRPIRSHWGITGGSFVDTLGQDKVNALDLEFIQTSFSFLNPKLDEFAKAALTSATKVGQNPTLSGKDIKAPTGFIHSYDLTRLFLSAANKIELTGVAKADRRKIKKALEALSEPIKGLIKVYQSPFSAYSKDNPDAHEALRINDFVMAHFDENGDIRLNLAASTKEEK